jgi:hypothetical protein
LRPESIRALSACQRRDFSLSFENAGMSKTKKSWQEKLEDSKGLPRVEKVEGKLSKRWGEGTFVIPAPIEVDEIMRRVPKGKLTTIDSIRKELASKHGANFACPITTGIFAWIAAHAAEEKAAEGKKKITPYWRTLKTGGELNPKYPGGVERLKQLLADEGHAVVQKGKRVLIADYERKLVAPST